jgi:hypothetical protein
VNPREAVAVVAVFQAAWGHVEVNERTMAVWHDVVREIPADEGLEIARQLVRESQHFPAPSAFYAAWKGARRHAAERARFAGALPSGDREVPADVARAHIARCREALRTPDDRWRHE